MRLSVKTPWRVVHKVSLLNRRAQIAAQTIMRLPNRVLCPHYREVDYQPDVPGRAHYQKPVCPCHHLGTACAPKKDSAPLPPIQTTAPSLTTHLQGGESDPGQVVSQEYKD